MIRLPHGNVFCTWVEASTWLRPPFPPFTWSTEKLTLRTCRRVKPNNIVCSFISTVCSHTRNYSFVASIRLDSDSVSPSQYESVICKYDSKCSTLTALTVLTADCGLRTWLRAPNLFSTCIKPFSQSYLQLVQYHLSLK